MNYKKIVEDFNKRWSVTSDASYQEEFAKFKVRVLNIFEGIDFSITHEGISEFCMIWGIKENWHEGYSGGKYSQNVIDTLTLEKNEIKFYRLLQIIFHLPYKKYNQEGAKKIDLFSKLLQAIELSNVNLSFSVKENELFFHPKGEEKFDTELVDGVVKFLDEKSCKHYTDALNLSLKFSSANAVKSAECLRRSLEEFLRFKLNNGKGLDANITELGKKMKDESVDSSIRNIIQQTFSHLDKYFNENSKHKDGDITQAENEFLIYQTGVLMKYLDRIILNVS